MNGRRITIPLIIGGFILVIVVGVGIFLVTVSKNDSTATGSSSASNLSTPNLDSTSSSTQAYKDGSYEATGSYSTPGGRQSIKINLAIQNGTIKSVNVTPEGTDLKSIRYEQQFASGISPVVVGKKIDQAFVSGRINGSSLTGDGFNNALSTIIDEAKV